MTDCEELVEEVNHTTEYVTDLFSFCFKWRFLMDRTYMYMDSVYPGRGIISKKNRKLFDAWDKSDPVDEWKCERTKKIEKIQGNRNEVLMAKC